MTNEQQLKFWLCEDENRISALLLASACAMHFGIKDWCIAAGFVRNLVWNELHELSTPTQLTDIDFIYFDRENISKQRDKEIEAWLLQNETSVSSVGDWSVKNQARMHSKNGDAPYLSCLNAMEYWPEQETAVGVYLDVTSINDSVLVNRNKYDLTGKLQILAAFELDSLFKLQLTPNPKRSLVSFFDRVEQKSWLIQFPKLRLNI